MLIVLTGTALLIAGGFIYMGIYGSNHGYTGRELSGYVIGTMFALFFFVGVGFICSFSADIATAHTIDSKIEMCEQENAAIEEKISVAVENYLKHENDTLTNLNPEEAMAILAAYPELKSDSLVSAQVRKYITNSNEIKILKSQKIDISIKKWWLYFGS